MVFEYLIVNTFLPFYGTRKFIPVFARVTCWTLPEADEFGSNLIHYLSEDHYNIILLNTTVYYFSIFSSGFHIKISYAIIFSPCVLSATITHYKSYRPIV
jgi:hypothetical protein